MSSMQRSVTNKSVKLFVKPQTVAITNSSCKDLVSFGPCGSYTAMKSELLTRARGWETCEYIASVISGICVWRGLIRTLTWGMMWSTDNLEVTTCSTCQQGKPSQPPSVWSSPHCTYIKFLLLNPTPSFSSSFFSPLHARLTADWQFDGVKCSSEEKWELTARTFDASVSGEATNNKQFH